MNRRVLSVMLALVLALVIMPHVFAEEEYTLNITGSRNHQVSVGDEFQVEYTITPKNLVAHKLVWSSNNSYVAQVDDGGHVTACAAGQALISITMDDSFYETVYVDVLGNAVTELEIGEENFTLEDGKSKTLSYRINSDADDQRVKWTSSDEDVATVSGDGTVTAVGGGISEITLTAVNGMSDSLIVTVPVPVSSVQIEPDTVSIGLNDTCQLEGYVFPGNAIDRTLKWESSRASVASVDSTGLVTGVSLGKARIRAMATNGKNAIVEVTVEVQPESLELDQYAVTLSEKNRTATIATRILPSDAGNKTLSWTSSDENVVTVSGGKLKAMNIGTATVTATTINGIAQTATVRVVVPVGTLTLSQEEYYAEVGGEPLKLTAAIAPDNADDTELLWEVSDETVASIDQDGTVTAIKAGDIYVRATAPSGVSSTSKLIVRVPVRNVSFAETYRTVRKYTSFLLEPVLEPADASDTAIAWSSSDTAVAAVLEDGTVYAKGEGDCVIYATGGNGITAECALTVVANPDVTPKYIALTFDNGPTKNTAQTVAMLDKYGVKGTFFLLGKNVADFSDVVQLMVASGHEIGNHTYKNGSINSGKVQAVQESIAKTDEAVTAAAGVTPTVLRAPDANLSAEKVSEIGDYRYFIGWTLDSRDGKAKNAKEVYNTTMSNITDHAIVLYHDSYADTATALDHIVPELILKGYEFVTVTDMMKLTGITQAPIYVPPMDVSATDTIENEG